MDQNFETYLNYLNDLKYIPIAGLIVGTIIIGIGAYLTWKMRNHSQSQNATVTIDKVFGLALGSANAGSPVVWSGAAVIVVSLWLTSNVVPKPEFSQDGWKDQSARMSIDSEKMNALAKIDPMPRKVQVEVNNNSIEGFILDQSAVEKIRAKGIASVEISTKTGSGSDLSNGSQVFVPSIQFYTANNPVENENLQKKLLEYTTLLKSQNGKPLKSKEILETPPLLKPSEPLEKFNLKH